MTSSAPSARTQSTLPVLVVVAHVRAEVLGELDRDRADATGAGVDEHLVARSHVRLLDQRLPRREGDHRQRGGLGHRQTVSALRATSSSLTATSSANAPVLALPRLA